MAKLKIEVIELVAALAQKDEIIDLLQQKGVLEITVPPEMEGFTLGKTQAESGDTQRNIQLLQEARETLAKYAPEKSPLRQCLNLAAK